jgi:hypothetical protein
VYFRRHPLAHPQVGALRVPDGAGWTNLLTGAPLGPDPDFGSASGGLPFIVARPRAVNVR